MLNPQSGEDIGHASTSDASAGKASIVISADSENAYSDSGNSPPTQKLAFSKSSGPGQSRAMVMAEANSSLPLKGDFERMARRRFQNPKPFREGSYWWIKPWMDQFVGGKLERKQKRIRLASATMAEREVRKIASEHLRPLNQGLESIGSATNFSTYVNETYIPVVLPLMANTTRSRYRGVISSYLIPTFGELESSRSRHASTSTLLQQYGQQPAVARIEGQDS